LLASLKERFTHKKLDCFLRAEDKDVLDEDSLVYEAVKDVFALF